MRITSRLVSPTELDDARRASIRSGQLFIGHYSTPAAADYLGCSVSTIYRHLRQHGVRVARGPIGGFLVLNNRVAIAIDNRKD